MAQNVAEDPMDALDAAVKAEAEKPTYELAKEVACPYENCGAGEGMECLTHHNDGSAPSIRNSPHVVRVRAAED